ncbi:hypothetical protein [Borreliella turdi]|uniref:hypothetical protein n=1 Tax=Borreliella turdi TaxID=57863 RepID=UPI001F32D65B|nr:hypothetical protein [Borreliella turdi]
MSTVFLLLNTCNPDFNAARKDIKNQSSKKNIKTLKSDKKELKSKIEVTSIKK